MGARTRRCDRTGHSSRTSAVGSAAFLAGLDEASWRMCSARWRRPTRLSSAKARSSVSGLDTGASCAPPHTLPRDRPAGEAESLACGLLPTRRPRVPAFTLKGPARVQDHGPGVVARPSGRMPRPRVRGRAPAGARQRADVATSAASPHLGSLHVRRPGRRVLVGEPGLEPRSVGRRRCARSGRRRSARAASRRRRRATPRCRGCS